MLGAPNRGSFACVQALRGTYPFMRRMSTLDHRHSAEDIAQNVFCTFPGLYQMLPPPWAFKEFDLFDARSWPADGPVPSAKLLAQMTPNFESGQFKARAGKPLPLAAAAEAYGQAARGGGRIVLRPDL